MPTAGMSPGARYHTERRAMGLLKSLEIAEPDALTEARKTLSNVSNAKVKAARANRTDPIGAVADAYLDGKEPKSSDLLAAASRDVVTRGLDEAEDRAYGAISLAIAGAEADIVATLRADVVMPAFETLSALAEETTDGDTIEGLARNRPDLAQRLALAPSTFARIVEASSLRTLVWRLGGDTRERTAWVAAEDYGVSPFTAYSPASYDYRQTLEAIRQGLVIAFHDAAGAREADEWLQKHADEKRKK